MNGWISLVATTTLALGFVACGDGDDSNGSSGGTGTTSEVSSNVAKDKPLSMVTDAELQEVTKSYTEALGSSEFTDAMCNFAGALVSAVPQAAAQPGAPTCEQIVSECKQSAASAPQMQTTSVAAPAANTAALAGCNITVGEYEACLTQALQAITQVFGGLTCGSDITMIDMTTTFDTASLSACEALNTQCAGALGGGSAGF